MLKCVTNLFRFMQIRSQRGFENPGLVYRLATDTVCERIILEEAYSSHLQDTKVCFQAVSNQNGVGADEAQ